MTAGAGGGRGGSADPSGALETVAARRGGTDPNDGLLAVYCGVGYTTVRFAVGSRQSNGGQNAGLSAILVQTGLGRVALACVLGLRCTRPWTPPWPVWAT